MSRRLFGQYPVRLLRGMDNGAFEDDDDYEEYPAGYDELMVTVMPEGKFSLGWNSYVYHSNVKEGVDFEFIEKG